MKIRVWSVCFNAMLMALFSYVAWLHFSHSQDRRHDASFFLSGLVIGLQLACLFDSIYQLARPTDPPARASDKTRAIFMLIVVSLFAVLVIWVLLKRNT